MIAVDEREVERATFGEELRDNDLRFGRVVLNQLSNSRLLEDL